MTRHIWVCAYRDAIGARQRCERCGMLSTWPGASAPCAYRGETLEEQHARQARMRAARDAERAAMAAARAEASAARHGGATAAAKARERYREQKAAHRAQLVQRIGLDAVRAMERARKRQQRQEQEGA